MDSKIRLLLVCFLGCSLTASGCAEGPLWRLGYLNPWTVRRWKEEEEMLASLSSSRAQIRSIAERAADLELHEADAAVEQLRQIALDDEVLLSRVAAVQTLAIVPSPEAAQALSGLLSDPEERIRLAAAEGLGSRPAVEAIGPLRGVLEKENDLDIRLAAARSLAEFEGEPAAIDALGIALRDRAPALQYRAMQSLATVTGEKFGYDASKWVNYLESGGATRQARENSSWNHWF